MNKFFQRFLAGIFMGFAEITPGISGATIEAYLMSIKILFLCLQLLIQKTY